MKNKETNTLKFYKKMSVKFLFHLKFIFVLHHYALLNNKSKILCGPYNIKNFYK